MLGPQVTPVGDQNEAQFGSWRSLPWQRYLRFPPRGRKQTQRVAGTIDKVEGKTLTIKSASGPVTLTLADNALIVARVKATAADIKAGDYVASGGVPQPDGTQKAVELRIFPESMRGNGDGHRPGWPGAPNGT